MKKSRFMIAGSLLTLTMAFGSTSAIAQEVDSEQTSAEDADKEAIITVTGSRINNPNLTAAVPITTIVGEDLLESGSVSIGDELNKLPALRSTFSQSNSTRFLGTAGLNLLDLRGLGTQRT